MTQDKEIARAIGREIATKGKYNLSFPVSEVLGVEIAAALESYAKEERERIIQLVAETDGMSDRLAARIREGKS